MRQFDNGKSGTEFTVTVPGQIVMPGFMNARVYVKLCVNNQYRELVQMTVLHPNFKQKVSLGLAQLSDGREMETLTQSAYIRPEENQRVSIQPFTWHWQIPVQIYRYHLDDFISAAEHFFKLA